jgi:protoheme IX farnesyltransferase
LKRQSATNTLVGAVSGRFATADRLGGCRRAVQTGAPYFRWQLMLEPGAIYLFLLLFLWQLPHFLAINWMYRDEYRKGGFVMLANDDEHGARTSRMRCLCHQHTCC